MLALLCLAASKIEKFGEKAAVMGQNYLKRNSAILSFCTQIYEKSTNIKKLQLFNVRKTTALFRKKHSQIKSYALNETNDTTSPTGVNNFKKAWESFWTS